MNLENTEKLVLFHSLESAIKREDLLGRGKNNLYPIKTAEEFFYEAVESIESIIEDKKPYKFNPKNVKEILEFLGYSLRPSPDEKSGLDRIKRELGLAISDFRKYEKELGELEENSIRFYQDEQKKNDLIEICSKMKDYYQGLVAEEDFIEFTTPED